MADESEIFHLSFVDGKITETSGQTKTVKADPAHVEEDGSYLLGENDRIVIPRETLWGGVNDFTIALSIEISQAGTGGVFFDVYSQMRAWVSQSGSIGMLVKTASGNVFLESAAGIVTADDWHRVAISFEGGEAGTVSIFLDGEEVATTDIDASTIKLGAYNPVVGNSYSSSISANVADIEMHNVAWDEDGAVHDMQTSDYVPQDYFSNTQATVTNDSSVVLDDDVVNTQLVTDFLDGTDSAPTSMSVPTSGLVQGFAISVPVDDATSSDETVIVVSTNAELLAAIKTLSAGDGGRIELVNTGEHYNLEGYKLGSSTGTITITSADPDDQAMFGSVYLNQAKNFVFDDLYFDGSDEGGTGKVFRLLNSDNITLTNSLFEGDSDGFLTGWGEVGVGRASTYIRSSTNILIENNEFSHMGQAFGMVDNTNVTIRGNDIHHLTFDAFQISGMINTLIEQNYVHDNYFGYANLNHSDMIQVYSNSYNTQNTENLTIRDNILVGSAETGSQSIFIRNENYVNDGELFQNIVIENNTIYNGHLHGVTVSDAVGVTVSNNTMLYNAGAVVQSSAYSAAGSSTPTIRFNNVLDGTITDNITGGIIAEGATSSGNVIVDYTNPLSANYIGSNIVNVTAGQEFDIRDLAITSDSAWAGIGSSHTQPGVADELTAVIRHTVSDTQVGVVTFDATQSQDANGYLTDGVSYIWTFSDGTQAVGPIVSHQFAEGVRADATLTIITASGESVDVTRSLDITADTLVSINFDNGVVDDTGAADAVLEAYGITEGGVFDLTGSSKVSISADEIFDQQSFTLATSLQVDAPGQGGVFLDMYGDMRATYHSDGSVSFWVQTEEGRVTAQTEPGLILDTDWHRVAISVEGGEGGAIEIFVDGGLAGSAALTSPIVDTGTYPLMIGNTWHASVIGHIDDFSFHDLAHDAAWAANDYDVAINHGESMVLDHQDTVMGTDGDDVLFSMGAGATLTGGDGGDIFVFHNLSAETVDQINDFSQSQGDQMVFDAAEFGLGQGGLFENQFAASTAEITNDTLFYIDEGKLWYLPSGGHMEDAKEIVNLPQNENGTVDVTYESLLFL